MNKFTRFCITSAAETAVKKLKKAKIGVYDIKKEGASVYFSVKDKHTEKVFAIFAKPCYNIKAVKYSLKQNLAFWLKIRAGLAVGAAAFIALAAFANTIVFGIEVKGSGSYLKSEVLRIIYDEGAREYTTCSSLNVPAATGRILALPLVTFCNIQKCGSILVVDVETEEESGAVSSKDPLICDVEGVIQSIVAICGTAEKEAGDEVKKGDILISAYTMAESEMVESIAVGYAKILCTSHTEYFAEEESQSSLTLAYASIIADGEIISRSHTVKKTGGGCIYMIDFTYLHTISINLS